MYSDLRIIDLPDAGQPDHDIVAVYLRSQSTVTNKAELNVRLDFLDLSPLVDFDLYLALDYLPGGNPGLPIQATSKIYWEYLIALRSGGEIEKVPLKPDKENITVQVHRDPQLDSLTLKLTGESLQYFPPYTSVQVFLTPAGSTQLTDQTDPVFLSAYPPPKAPILFTFWNTLPAYTPVQAVRRWDGAHTGPYGGRHGLYNLLKTARGLGIPLTLLDLKFPASLSALDYLGGIRLVTEMGKENLLILPDTIPIISPDKPSVLPEGMATGLINRSHLTALRYGLPASPFLHIPHLNSVSSSLFGRYRLVFSPDSGIEIENSIITSIQRQGDLRVIAYPVFSSETTPFEQATPNGPSLELRRAFAELAYARGKSVYQDVSKLLVLGGNLPASSWGDSASARTTFTYIKAHPWIQVLDATDLLTMKVDAREQLIAPHIQLSQQQTQALEKLTGIEDSTLDEIAWQTLEGLLSPTYPFNPGLPSLRENYWRQIYYLVRLYEENKPAAQGADCHVDLDWDGIFECILSNPNFLIAIDPKGGSILYGFARDDSGLHQILAPTSQFSSGQSDPFFWDLGKGLSSDPAVIPGAFLDDSGPYNLYYQDHQITFFGSKNVRWKQYRLIGNRLVVDYDTALPIQLKVPLAVDPWIRYTPNWGDQYEAVSTKSGLRWGLKSGVSLEIQTSATIHYDTFMDTRNRMGTTEDPNLGNPPGHFLPFPLALATINGNGRFSIEFTLLQ